MTSSNDLTSRVRSLLSQPTEVEVPKPAEVEVAVAEVAKPTDRAEVATQGEDPAQLGLDLELTKISETFAKYGLESVDNPEEFLGLLIHWAKVNEAKMQEYGKDSSPVLDQVAGVLAKFSAERGKTRPGVDPLPAVLIKEFAGLVVAKGEGEKKSAEAALLRVDQWLREGSAKVTLERMQGELEIQRSTFETRLATAVQIVGTQLTQAQQAHSAVVHHGELAAHLRSVEIVRQEAWASEQTLKVASQRGPRERALNTAIVIEEQEGRALQEIAQRQAAVTTKQKETDVTVSERIAELDATEGVANKAKAHALALSEEDARNLLKEAEVKEQRRKAYVKNRKATARLALVENNKVRYTALGITAAAALLLVRACNSESVEARIDPYGAPAVGQDQANERTTSQVPALEMTAADVTSPAVGSVLVLPQPTQAPQLGHQL